MIELEGDQLAVAVEDRQRPVDEATAQAGEAPVQAVAEGQELRRHGS